MEEGGFPGESTTETTPDTSNNDDDSTQPPFETGATSTQAGGERIPMTTRTRLPQEGGPSIAETSFSEPTQSLAWNEITVKFPMADENKLKARYKMAPRAGGGGGRAVIEVAMKGKDKWYRLYTKSPGDTEKSFNESLPKEIKNALGTSLNEPSYRPGERTTVSQGPGEAAWNALKGLFPDVRATDVEAYIDPKSKSLMVKKPGDNQTAYPLYAQQKETGTLRLNPNIPPELRTALGESAVDQVQALQKEREKTLREIVQKKE